MVIRPLPLTIGLVYDNSLRFCFGSENDPFDHMDLITNAERLLGINTRLGYE